METPRRRPAAAQRSEPPVGVLSGCGVPALPPVGPRPAVTSPQPVLDSSIAASQRRIDAASSRFSPSAGRWELSCELGTRCQPSKCQPSRCQANSPWH
ncbi:hypothetical protein G7Z17_g5580 [Cylindrodendrum hubeiense]|uniref:Uncharacterized protein n=1 Tax=Cylindrodendrum hubeiense TaxID=595255 RepID=A0A9P5HGU0_9HYPO|nr:hypothetical protein G7Z17_g5580 [Cylindrodendrum hubeiense]